MLGSDYLEHRKHKTASFVLRDGISEHGKNKMGGFVLENDYLEHGKNKVGGFVLENDLPLERKPWEVLPLLYEVRDYLYGNWRKVSIRANSIGAWFSLLSFQGRKVDQALFVSPLLDMRRFIEEQPTREEDYYSWVLEHPVTRWNAPTFILRPEVDSVVSEESTRDFIRQHNCRLTVMRVGEHWFHTPEQLSFLREWEQSVIRSPEASCRG